MAILDELTEQEVSKNKAIRGYIVRAPRKRQSERLARPSDHKRPRR